jgi:hypothetical protein
MTAIYQIQKDLMSGKSITPLQALNKYGCFRLAAAIHKLRKEGMAIETEYVTQNGKTFVKYFLTTEE